MQHLLLDWAAAAAENDDDGRPLDSQLNLHYFGEAPTAKT
jgi:hypothetical protein